MRLDMRTNVARDRKWMLKTMPLLTCDIHSYLVIGLYANYIDETSVFVILIRVKKSDFLF